MFKNHGFPHYDAMSTLGLSKASGKNVFQPTQKDSALSLSQLSSSVPPPSPEVNDMVQSDVLNSIEFREDDIMVTDININKVPTVSPVFNATISPIPACSTSFLSSINKCKAINDEAIS